MLFIVPEPRVWYMYALWPLTETPYFGKIQGNAAVCTSFAFDKVSRQYPTSTEEKEKKMNSITITINFQLRFLLHASVAAKFPIMWGDIDVCDKVHF